MGIPNELTRETDVTLDSNSRPKKVQSFYGNGDDVIVVSNHINAGGGDNPSGKLTFFEKKFNKFSKYDIIFTEKAVFNL